MASDFSDRLLTTPKSVQKLQTALHAKAKAEAGYRFYALYDKISRDDILVHAYAQCRSNKSLPLRRQGARRGLMARILRTSRRMGSSGGWPNWRLRSGRRPTDQSQSDECIYPKANGKLRPLGISSVRDRVCMTAALLVLQPIFEADLPPEIYAYRDGRNAQQAVVEVEELLFRGHPDVVDADLADYFGSISHANLLKSVLLRLGLGCLKALDPPAPVVRYERERPGELLHLDTKKLGRIAGVGHRITGQHSGMVKNRGIGWEALHVCVDDASRLAYTELLPDEQKKSAIAFLDRALAWFDRLGVGVERVMTDNGSAYRSHAFRSRLAQLGIRHIRTRPYTPKTNGKAERFIQTSLRKWAYARPYHSSAERDQAMQSWIADYNHTRPHSALGGKPPLEKLNNVLGFNT